tara:strand:+ start:20702 stop:23107 length:2406 start_codon:yes stop_codon:yes gene_type:complete
MAVNYNTISEKIFAVLKGSGYNVKMYSAGEGMETPDPQEAKFFYVEQPNLMIHIDDDLGEVNFHKGEESLKEIETVVGNVKQIAQNNLLDFNIKQFGKTIEPKNYVYKLNKHNKADTTMTDIQTESYSPLVGSSKTSEQKLEGAKLIIKHRKAVDDETPGSRSRSIKSLYVANNDGERFKYPFNHLAGARAMARHVAEGGTPYDDIGASICQLSERIAQLRDVAMVARNSQIAENTKDLMPLVQEKLAEMRMAVQKITTEGGYKEYAKNYKKSESLAELDEESSESLKSLFTVQSYNEKMDKVLPLLNSLVREKEEVERSDVDLTNYAKQKVQSGDIEFHQKTKGQEKYDPRKIGRFADPAAELTYRLKDLAANIKDDELSNFMARTAYKLDKYSNQERDHGLTKAEVDTAKELVKIGTQKQKDIPIVPDKDDPLDDEAMESISEAFSIDRMLGELAPSRLKMDYVGSKVDQTLSYDNWLKQTKGIERGANGISADQHIKFAPEYKAYKSGMKKEEVSVQEKDTDNDGDKDFADVMVARMVASGMSKEDAIEKVKDKKYNEAEVDEELTDKQENLPDHLKKAILKKQGNEPIDEDMVDDLKAKIDKLSKKPNLSKEERAELDKLEDRMADISADLDEEPMTQADLDSERFSDMNDYEEYKDAVMSQIADGEKGEGPYAGKSKAEIIKMIRDEADSIGYADISDGERHPSEPTWLEAIAKELEQDTPKSFGETEMETSDLDRIIHLAGINEGKKDKKVALPSGKEIKKCHSDGMSKAAIMKKYKDCDKEKLEKLYDAHCMGK